MQDTTQYAAEFNDSGFWRLVKGIARNLPFVRDVVAMFFCMRDPATPLWVKTTILGALGYFVCPVDVIPDIFPIIGWTDDAGVIAGALGIIRSHIRDKHWQQADDVLG